MPFHLKRKLSDYESIIDLPHRQSKKRTRMSMEDRAAQFSPFAALTGHEEAIEETARLTDGKLILTEEEKERLNETLSIAVEFPQKEFSFLYFVPDEKKKGGKYLSVSGSVKKVDFLSKSVILTNKKQINIDDIIEIEEIN